jgi:hypothetical protein
MWMKASTRILIMVVVLGILSAAPSVLASPTLIDFETPSLGTDARQIINPYVDATSGVKFTAEPGGFGDEVVGLVKNSATSACVDPSDTNQKLGTGRDDGTPGGSIGLSGFAIKATFPAVLSPPVTVSAEFQTLAGQPIRLRLFDATGTQVAATTDTAAPADGTCGYPGDSRARKTITVTANQQVAYAIMDMDTATGGFVFVIDNFDFTAAPGTGFPAGPADDITRSLGSFRILVHPQFRPLMAGYPGYDGLSRLQSPNLFDPHTVIGRSAVHTDGDATDSGGTSVGTASTLISDSTFSLLPPGFEGPPGTREVHTEVRSLNMTSWQCAGVPGVAVRAGTHAPGRPISPGEVESQNTGTDFPAESFFDVFAEIDLPAAAGFPGGTLYNPVPLLVENINLTSFPPRVVYRHANSNAVPVRFRDSNPGFWNAGDLFGWVVLAGHAPGFDCGDTEELEGIVQEFPEVQPEPVEIDQFMFSQAQITLQTATGGQETVQLRGPSTVHVFIDELTGQAKDTDNDGLDQVQTEMVQLELRGNSSLGPVTVRLSEAQPSTGEIEEKVNNTPGVLDLPPFAASGTADSFFDVWFEIEVGPPGQSQVLHVADPVHMATVISHKPPVPGETYQNPFTQPIPLLDQNGNPIGLSILDEVHTPNPPTERDHFPETQADITLIAPDGSQESLTLSGPTQVNVFFEGQQEGQAADDDGDGLDEVATEIQEMTLTGTSSMGPVEVRLNPNIPSTGLIEEKENKTPGVLDIPPFTDTGGANSFFDVFFEVQLGDTVLHTEVPKHMASMISHKPPAPGDVYENPDTIPLLDANGRPSGFSIGPAKHVPRPHVVEHDDFPNTQAQVTLVGPDGSEETVDLQGPAQVDVWFEQTEGAAQDDDNNGLDEVMTKLMHLELVGQSSMGPVRVGLNPALMSTGLIEEKENNNPGLLDIPPFTATGAANSRFEIFFEIQVGDVVLHNVKPKIMQSMILHKPPERGATYEGPETIELLLPNGEPSGYALGPARHVPNPYPNDHFQCYRTQSQPLDVSVLLRDQFDADETEALVLEALRFCNPVEKIHVLPGGGEIVSPIRNPDAHLKFYRIETSAPMAARQVVVSNQFGRRQVFKVSEPVALAVPTQKLPHEPPEGLDHFKCYQANGESVNATVGLKDQFHASPQVRVLDPVVFCNPVEKTHGDIVTPIRNPAVHLACYNIEAEPLPESLSVTVRNQFGAEDLVVDRPEFLCVPSLKIKVRPTEVDHFEATQALIGLRMPDGSLVNKVLSGPATVEVDLTSLADSPANGLEEVATELVSMELSGGGVILRAGRALGLLPSRGQIEEKVNVQSGRLDLPGPDSPFCTPPVPADCAGTQANSFFDVYFEIEVSGVGKLHNEKSLRLEAMIDQKPPKARYRHVITAPIELFDENGQPTGIFLVTAEHSTIPPEVDVFPRTLAGLRIEAPGGQQETVRLRGPSTVHVFIDEATGAADDTDGDNLDQVQTRMAQLELKGHSSLGLVTVRLNDAMPSVGEIEELANNMPGVLDLPPFADTGVADSFFDIFIELEVGRRGQFQVLHTQDPVRMESEITHKPPARGEVYRNSPTGPVELFDANGRPTGVKLIKEINMPNPPIRIRISPRTKAKIVINTPQGKELVPLEGALTAHMFVDDAGTAEDTDDDGLDEVPIDIIDLELRGEHSSLGSLVFRLNPDIPSTGLIEEQVNNTPGVLDLPPFVGQGMANSFFDVFFEVELESARASRSLQQGSIFHTDEPVRIQTTLTSQEPLGEETYQGSIPVPVELLDENDTPTEFTLEDDLELTGSLPAIYLPIIYRD